MPFPRRSPGPLNAGLVRMVGLEYEAQADPVDWLLTAAVSAGTVGATAGREQTIVARGGALLFPLGARFTVTGRSAAAAALRIPLRAAADLAEENTGLPAAELRFESMGPVSAAVGGLFTQTATFICGELVTSGWNHGGGHRPPLGLQPAGPVRRRLPDGLRPAAPPYPPPLSLRYNRKLAMTTVTPLRRIEFASSDPLEIRDFLHRVRGSRMVLNGTRDRGWRVSLTQVDAGEFSSSQMRLPADIAFRMHGRDEVVIHTILGGTVGLDHGKASHRYRLGDVYVASCPRVDFTCHTHEVRSQTITLPQSLLTEVARVTPDPPGGPWEFLPFAPVTASGARQWREAARYVDGLLSGPAAAATPLVLGSAARLLAATALTVFPNTAVTEPAARDRTDAHPATLHRAVSFIEANADIDITITDIARAAGVTTRAIQLAFRRHLDTTPAGYLRRIRLDQAHRQLQAADPDRDSVTAVAYRWGFSSPSRFASYYRRVFGVHPSHTLRS